MEARAAELNQLVERGRKLRDAGRWTEAIACYSAANEIDGSRYDIKHNLALSLMAANHTQEANRYLDHAIALKPDLWPSHILKAKVLREKGEIEAADDVLMHVLKYDPQNGHALLAAADLDMNEFGDAVGARERVAPLLKNPHFRADAELTTLMSKLYDRNESDEALSHSLIDFARCELSMRDFKYSQEALAGCTTRSERKRLGLLSPLFCLSPVYFLTISTFRLLAKQYDLIILNRGSREDLGTTAFKAIAAEWHDVKHLEAPILANAIKRLTLDGLIDLGGWSDPVGLKALSVKPAAKMLKWVGGQSATTGISSFDGFISDPFQSPKHLQSLYVEPLLLVPQGYAHYTPAPYEKSMQNKNKGSEIGVIGNPAKISQEFIQREFSTSRKYTLVDRRYKYSKTIRRIETHRRNLEFIAPPDRASYLKCVSNFASIIDTYPYNAGVTAVEALNLGVQVLVRPGKIISSRHTLSHKSSLNIYGGDKAALSIAQVIHHGMATCPKV